MPTDGSASPALVAFSLLSLSCQCDKVDGLDPRRPWPHTSIPCARVSCTKTGFTPTESAAIRELEILRVLLQKMACSRSRRPIGRQPVPKGGSTSYPFPRRPSPSPRAPLIVRTRQGSADRAPVERGLGGPGRRGPMGVHYHKVLAPMKKSLREERRVCT